MEWSLTRGQRRVESTARLRLGVIHDQALAMPDDQFAAMQPMMAANLVISPEGQRLVAAGSVASDRTMFMNSMVEDLQTDLRPEMAKIKTPALLLYPRDSFERSSSRTRPA